MQLPFNKLNSHEWSDLLQYNPSVADKCDKWDEFDEFDWCHLICVRPEFVEKCNMLKTLSGGVWVQILKAQPHLEDLCTQYKGWNKIRQDYFSNLLAIQPQFARHCPCWNQFSGCTWNTLLSKQPQFIDQYIANAGKMESNEIVSVLIQQPQLANQLNLDELWPHDWAVLIRSHPEFVTKCKCLDKLGSKIWVILLKYHFIELANYCTKWQEFDTDDWSSLFTDCPSVVEIFAKQTTNGWFTLLLKYPELITECDCIDKFTAHHWKHILLKHPELAKYCPDKIELDTDTMLTLIRQHPEILDIIEKKKENN